MIFDAKVEVACEGDECHHGPDGESIFVDLHAGTCDTYLADTATIEREIRRQGWTVRDGKHYCENCAEELKS